MTWNVFPISCVMRRACWHRVIHDVSIGIRYMHGEMLERAVILKPEFGGGYNIFFALFAVIYILTVKSNNF